MKFSDIRLRSAQEEIISYNGGLMGVAAVPGAGKTFTLSLLAAKIIASNKLREGQEVLVVTLVNSAVDNFYRRVNQFVSQEGLLAFTGYRVRTLHGLANDIVRERPGLVQLEEGFEILDERDSDAIRREAAHAWLRSHQETLTKYIKEDIQDKKLEWLRRNHLPDLVDEIAKVIIRSAKDRNQTPAQLQQQLADLSVPLSLAQMGVEIYANYQRALDYRGAVDFDDLVRHAYTALVQDQDFLERLQSRWPYILEDEAQDSSLLQQNVLSLLAGKSGNWVRVGDPNQAIYETFTTASPEHMVNFLSRPDVKSQPLPNSGRSTGSIISLANCLVTWSASEHPAEPVRNALLADPLIQMTPVGDPQPNPDDTETRIYFHSSRLTPQQEVELVVNSLARWLPDHPEATIAVLSPRNQRGFELTDELKRRGLPYMDGLLRSSSSTRYSAGALGHILRYLADPASPGKLAKVYEVWRRDDREDGKPTPEIERIAELLRKVTQVECFISPSPGSDWVMQLIESGVSHNVVESLLRFREHVLRWQHASLLPIDQMILAIAQDLFQAPNELAIAHKLAVMLKQSYRTHPTWRLNDLSEELAVIARNERRFLGFSEEDSGFDPNLYRGKVVVATMHKAKGLEWDRVYLMSVNSYDFPSALEGDQFISEPWYIRDRLNLAAEALVQLDAATNSSDYTWYQEGVATSEARINYAKERLRLLYVGITRARKELMITWNSGREGNLQPAVPFVALESYWTSASLKKSRGDAVMTQQGAIAPGLTLPPGFQFSQSNLQDFQDCHRRFELRHILDYFWPAMESEPAEENERFRVLGTEFHLLAHQFFVGIPVETLDEYVKSEPLQGWWENLKNLYFQLDLDKTSNYPEITLTGSLCGFRLTATYDLIAHKKNGNFIIFDWKTAHKPLNRQYLIRRVQSKVYPYLLRLAGACLNKERDIPCDAIEMVYWDPAYKENLIHLKYNEDQYHQDEHFLREVINQIVSIPLGNFDKTKNKKRCAYCKFRSLCDRGEKAGNKREEEEFNPEEDSYSLDLDFDQIMGIEF